MNVEIVVLDLMEIGIGQLTQKYYNVLHNVIQHANHALMLAIQVAMIVQMALIFNLHLTQRRVYKLVHQDTLDS